MNLNLLFEGHECENLLTVRHRHLAAMKHLWKVDI